MSRANLKGWNFAAASGSQPARLPAHGVILQGWLPCDRCQPHRFLGAWQMAVWMLLSVVSIGGAASAGEPDRQFDDQIAPLLAARCLGCHGPHEGKGGLDLSSAKSMLKGGQTGPAVQPGNLSGSLIWDKIQQDEMPPKKPLTGDEKGLIKTWIESGARWGVDPINPLRYTTDNRAGYDWWSLRPLRRPALPPVREQSWVRNDIDRFILARLEQANLAPASEADRRTYIRRLSFDLLGLPPTLADVEAFETDPSPDAYERLVERYLDAPSYGERWARHWLDIVRFGESQGFERDKLRPNSWRYRDWVVWALNRDLPYRDFVRMQVAGDVIAPADPLAVVATGYLVAAPWDEVGQMQQSAAMRAVVRQDELEDVVGTTIQTFLGLTANCARCHDHKFDPISQIEYYRLAAALGGVRHGERESLAAEGRGAVQPRLMTLDSQHSALIEALLGSRPPGSEPLPIENIARDKLPSPLTEAQFAERQQWIQKISQIDAERRLLQGGATYAILPRQPEVTHLLLRGNPATPAGVVAPGGIHALGDWSAEFELSPDSPEAARRVRLAEWLVDPRNPLPLRVMANRLWHYHFGTGIVDTPNDFGFNGARPSHPELLDWLASELVEQQGSLKALHRTIVLSATYRQGGEHNPAAQRKDSDNRLLWRKSPLRLDAEAVRDAVLSVTGTLNPALGGPSFQDFKTFTANSQFYEQIDPVGYEFQRRSLYRMWVRSGRNSLLDVLDCPDPSTTAPRRAVTTTPLQALALLNNSFMLRMADQLSELVLLDAPNDVPGQVRSLYKRVFQRLPAPEELEVAVPFAQQHGLGALARVLFNSNEFLYVD